MDYQKTIPFTANIEKALEVATNTLIPHGFQVTGSNRSALELVGTGTMLTKSREPLVGISKVNIRAGSGHLSIEAEFDAIRKTIKYLVLFILGMAVFFLVFFALLFSRQGQPLSRIILISLAPFVPWPFIFPVMAKFFKWRTTKALDTLLHNITLLAKET